MPACRRHPPLQVQQPALLRLPTRHQFALLGSARLRGKTRHVLDAQAGLFKAPGKQQGRRDQPDQLRTAQQQVGALLFIQTQQQHHVVLLEQVLEAKVLQQADGHFVFIGQQGLFKRRLPVLLGDEPLARTPMP